MDPEKRVLLRRSARVAGTALAITMVVNGLLALSYWFVIGSFFFEGSTANSLDLQGAALLGVVAILANGVLVYVATAIPMIIKRFYPGQRTWGFVVPVGLFVVLVVVVAALLVPLLS